MSELKKEWLLAKSRLVSAVQMCGFPEELGEAVARQLGSPKAMDRMRVYLENVKPNSAELVVDEMLSISEEIEAWRKKKESQEANARYNEIMLYGLEEEE